MKVSVCVTSAVGVVTNAEMSTLQRAQSLKTIEGVELKVEVCLDSPTLTNANYSNKRVTYCSGGLLGGVSLFKQVAMLAHELGHSLEPCRFGLKANPFNSVEQCLRKNDSVAAQVWGFKDLNQFEKACSGYQKTCEIGLSISCESIERMGCKEKAPRCLKDQINESFSDWFSAEVLAQMLQNHEVFLSLTKQQLTNGFRNIIVGSCESNYPLTSVYPQPHARYSQILLAHPVVQSKLTCSLRESLPRHCQ